jgi:hypothetical protein
MDVQNTINLIGGAVISVLGWFARELWSEVKSLKEEIMEMEREVLANHVRRDDYRQDMKEIKDMLGKIFDKLDGKVDK